MPARPPRMHSTALACAAAGLVALASCSVFPDEAVLPAGSGGVSPSSGGASTSGGAETTSGGRLGGGEGGASSGGNSAGGSSGTAGTPTGGGNNDGGMGSASGGSSGESGADSGGVGGVTGGGDGGNGITAGGEGGSGGSCSPTTITLTPVADAYIRETSSDRKKNFGSAPTLIVAGAPGDRARAALDFDWSELPSDVRVIHAELHLTLGARSGSADTTLIATRLAQAWVEGEITWVRASASSNWVTTGGDVALIPSASLSVPANASAGLAVDFDVTRDVIAVQAATEPAYGWLVLTETPDSSLEFGARESTFTDARPTLVVETCP